MKRTGDEQAKKDNLTVEEVSINFNFDDLDFSFDDFEIDLDIDLSFDDFDFDFLNEQKPNRRTNRERTKRNATRTQRGRSTSEAREKQNLPKTKPRGSREKIHLKRCGSGEYLEFLESIKKETKRERSKRNFEYFPTIKKRFSPL